MSSPLPGDNCVKFLQGSKKREWELEKGGHERNCRGNGGNAAHTEQLAGPAHGLNSGHPSEGLPGRGVSGNASSSAG